MKKAKNGNGMVQGVNEVQKRIDEAFANLNSLADFYQNLLVRYGLTLEQVGTLTREYDLATKTGIDVSGLVSDAGGADDFRVMAVKARSVARGELEAVLELGVKIEFLGELEKHEVEKLVTAYYVAVCACVLAPYLFL